jgi:hypothetical protein
LAATSISAFAAASVLPKAPEGEKVWIQYEFPQPQTVRAVTIVRGGSGPFDGFMPPGGETGKVLEASDDGQTYRVVASIPKGGATEHTISFEPMTAKFFRVTFKTLPPTLFPSDDFDLGSLDFSMPTPPTDYYIAELALHLELWWNPGSAWGSGFPSSEQAEALPVAAEEGFRLEAGQSVSESKQSRKQHQGQSSRIG